MDNPDEFEFGYDAYGLSRYTSVADTVVRRDTDDGYEDLVAATRVMLRSSGKRAPGLEPELVFAVASTLDEAHRERVGRYDVWKLNTGDPIKVLRDWYEVRAPATVLGQSAVSGLAT